MMLGARTGAWSGGAKWENPYITDGLSWCFVGDHDASSAEWKDVVGGVVATPSSGVTFDENKYRISGSTQHLSFAEPSAYADAIIEGRQFTVEMCLRVGYLSSGMNMIYIGSPSSPLINLRGVGSSGVSCVSLRGGGTVNITNMRAQMAATATVALVFSGNYFTTYVNGTRVKGSTAISSGSNIGRGNSVIGSNASSIYAWSGWYHSVRGYVKALTDAEIAANYGVDKERFSLQ